MMLLDANGWLGHYPFRAVPDNTPEALLRLMDRHGIAQAVVSSLHSVFYTDAHSGNEELAQWTSGHRDRLIPCATLNPAFPGWERDLRQCCDEWGMRGLRLFPTHHRYSLTSPQCLDLVRAATERALHIAIPLRLEDRRQQHWMDVTAEVRLAEIAALARACPEANILVLEAIGVETSDFVRDPSLASARVYFEFSRMATVLQRTIPMLLERLGAQRLVFGTGMPLKLPGPALLKLQLLEAPSEVKAQLAAGNMARLLGK
ncbi:MAG TPA: amidohydrolase family protein [Tepidisphaeraceae bacterium]|nr:amidohydrolase family protein [Tepidisphaeraceae bacterium]